MMTSSLYQRTPQWHAARRGKLTASNVGAALGLCPWTSRQVAFDRAMGRDKFKGKRKKSPSPPPREDDPPPSTGNDATRWGTANEPNGILAYTAHTGNIVNATGLHVHPLQSWIAGSPDGLIGTEGLLEVKCPYWPKKDGTRIHKEIPAHYYMQMAMCLETTKRQWCDFISWEPNGYEIYRVTYDEELHDKLLPHYLQFFGAMQREALHPPLMSTDDKELVRVTVEESMKKHIDYHFWKNTDPDDPAPALAYDDILEYDEPVCKRLRSAHG